MLKLVRYLNKKLFPKNKDSLYYTEMLLFALADKIFLQNADKIKEKVICK